MKRICKLEELLEKEWNTNLPKAVIVPQAVAEKKDEKKGFVFVKIKPLKDRAKLKCPICSTKISSIKLLRRHTKRFHPGEAIDEENIEGEDEPKVQCLLKVGGRKCGYEAAKNQMYRHLESRHEVKRPEQTHLRGFVSHNGDDGDFEVVFLRDEEDDPVDTTEENEDVDHNDSLTVENDDNKDVVVNADANVDADIVDADEETVEEITVTVSTDLPPVDAQILGTNPIANKLDSLDKDETAPHEDDIVGVMLNPGIPGPMISGDIQDSQENSSFSGESPKHPRKSLDFSALPITTNNVGTDDEDNLLDMESQMERMNEEYDSIMFSPLSDEGPSTAFGEKEESPPFYGFSNPVEGAKNLLAGLNFDNLNDSDDLDKSPVQYTLVEKHNTPTPFVRKKIKCAFFRDTKNFDGKIHDKLVKLKKDDEVNAQIEDHDQIEDNADAEFDDKVEIDNNAVIDSDSEEFDLQEDIERRKMNKKSRYDKRKELNQDVRLSSLEGNSDVIEDFKAFLRRKYFSTSSSSNKDSTPFNNTIAYLFTYPDSMLAWQTKKDPAFLLKYNVMFNDKEAFKRIEDPTAWISSLGGPTGREKPEDRKQMVKAWKRWAKYIYFKLHEKQNTFGESVEEQLRFNLLKTNINDIERMVDENQNLSQLSKLVNIEKRAKENAQEIDSPNKRWKEINAVKNWYKSKEHDEEEKKMQSISEEFALKEKVGNRNFTSYANWTRFSIVLTSKNRQACLNFRNVDWASRTPYFYPETPDPNFEPPPPEQDFSKPPPDKPNMKPNVWVIQLAGGGAGIKNQAAQVIYLNSKTEGYCKIFRTMKSKVLGKLDPEAQFFTNYQGNPLGPLTNTRGTLFRKFENATGLDSASVNTIRRGAEVHVFNSPAAAARVKDLQSHSAETGQGAYDKSAPLFRAAFMNHISTHIEGSNKEENVESVEMSEEAKARNANVEEEDQQMKIEGAAKALEKGQTRRNYSKVTRVLVEDRAILQNTLSDPSNFELFRECSSTKFPPLKTFKKYFYRAVDGCDNSSAPLKPVEERVFKNIKPDIEKEFDKEWDGSLEMNKKADFKVSAAIRNSLLAYERNRKKNQKPYFKF